MHQANMHRPSFRRGLGVERFFATFEDRLLFEGAFRGWKML